MKLVFINKKLSQKAWLFGLIVLLPLILLSSYYLMWCADRFQSTSIVAIKQSGGTSLPFLNFGNFTLPGMGGAAEDAYALKEYIQSPDMLNALQQQLNLRKLWSTTQADWFSRLHESATREEFLDYYRSRVAVEFNNVTSLVTIRVQGFTPEQALKINQAIVSQSERYMNDSSHRIAQEQMHFMEQEVARSQKRLQDAKMALLDYQNRNKVLNPIEEAKASLAQSSALAAALAEAEAELSQSLSYLSPSSFQIKSLQAKTASLREQVAKERERLTGGEESKLSRQSAQYLNLIAMVEIESQAFKASLAGLESTRIEASKKIKNLVAISQPNLPEEAKYPRRLYNLSIMAAVLLMSFGIARLFTAIIQDKRLK